MLERFINLKSVENSIESFFDNGSWVSIAVEAVAILVATAIINFLIDVIFKRIRIFLNNNNAKKEGFNWYIEIIKTVKLYPGRGTILGDPNIKSIFQILNNK